MLLEKERKKYKNQVEFDLEERKVEEGQGQSLIKQRVPTNRDRLVWLFRVPPQNQHATHSFRYVSRLTYRYP